MNLPLSLLSGDKRIEKMSLEYWTTLIEPKRCKVDPYGCPTAEYDKYLEASLKIMNVNVQGWDNGGKDSVELRLGMYD